MADCESGCTAQCSSGCGGACSTNCTTGCTDNCSGCGGACSSNCTYTCSGTCLGGCEGTCKSGCEGTCTASCSDSCYDSCKDDCLDTCKGQCKGYCASICQTYCQKAQTFTENLSPIANAVGKPKFSWSKPVKAKSETEEASTIIITASEWNILKGYIQTATQYCGGTSPSKADASSDPNSINNFISAEKYNDLANGLGLTNVKANETLISAALINALSSTYNDRKINSDLPNGEYPLTGNQNNCCQKGQTCMAEGQLLSHQKCKNQTPTKCGDQTTGK